MSSTSHSRALQRTIAGPAAILLRSSDQVCAGFACRDGRQVIVWSAALESPRAVNVVRFTGVDGVFVTDRAAVL